MRINQISSKTIIVLGGFNLIFFLSACVNDLETIQKITYDPKSPDEVTQNLHVLYVDSGYAKIELFAKYSETFHKPEELTKLKDGIKVNFFKENGEIVSTLTALYGEVNMQKGVIFVKDSVQLYNHAKQQRMETEQLNWNRQDSSVFTNTGVMVSSPKGTLYGEGIRTKQDFSTYTFIKPYGRVVIEEGDLD
jgi:LPS export ABC transporter protein LptC